ncbi:hypothetical protein Sjap_000409 [Stephania japonica]|uniref:O-methyltransferase C-terminal domain-containing protein n=1 Tax=Stephania japonica TaxID=461633 RepID=A0AAP0KJT6_9MAGN
MATHRLRLHMGKVWEFGLENLDVCNMFNEAIFQGLASLVDVGGAIVVMARAIAEAFPHIKCSVPDLPHVFVGCKGSENLEFTTVDIFQAIPSADAVLLKLVVAINGKQRTESEWKKLFTESGFASYKISPVLDFRSVIEVLPY